MVSAAEIAAAAADIVALRRATPEHMPEPLRLETALTLCQRAGYTPDDWQQRALSSSARQIALKCPRQTGKSLVASVLAAQQAIYQPGSLVLVLSVGDRQAGELFKRVAELYRGIGRPVSPDAETTRRIELTNGSRILALPGKEATIRGFPSVSLAIIDEAARVPDDLYYAIRPMLAVTGGRLVLLSTPFGKRGFFYEAWENGGKEWDRFEIKVEQCPRLTPEFLASEKRSMPDFWYRQEYGGEFIDSIDSPFNPDAIEHMFSDPSVKPLFG